MENKNKNVSVNKVLGNYIYAIKCQSKQGIGIFCKFFYQNLFLITTNNIINQNHPIEVFLNNTTIKLNIDNPYNYFDNDIAIIEINQNLNNISFVNIDNSILDDPNKKFKDKEVHLYDFTLANEKIKESIGIIQDINSGIASIDFLCFRAEDTLGGLIIYEDKDNNKKMNKFQLIGIYIKCNNKKYWKGGIFIKQYVKMIQNKLNQNNLNHKNDIKYINNNKIDNKNKYANNNDNKQINCFTALIIQKNNYNNNKVNNNININVNNQLAQNKYNNNINNQYNNNNCDYNNKNNQCNNNIMNNNNNNLNYNNSNNQCNNNYTNNNNNQINSNLNYSNMNNQCDNNKSNNTNYNENNMNNQYNNNENNMNSQYNNNENNMNNQYNNNENNMNSQYNNNENNQYNNKMSIQFNQNMNNINEINNQNNYNNMNNHNFNQSNINPNNQIQNFDSKNPLNKYEDIYPYINVKKFRITFIIQKNGNKKVLYLIPSSLRNSELYYTAHKINDPDFFEYSDVKFIELYIYSNNNLILIQNDDNVIDHHLNDGQILIKEITEIMTFNQSDQMMNILFLSDKGKKINVIIPFNITVKELINFFFNKIKISTQNQKYFSFFTNNKMIKLNDNNIFDEGFVIGQIINFKTEIVKNDSNYKYIKSNCPGKKISAFLKDKNEKSKLNPVIFAGTLQQIKNFYQELKKYLSQLKIEFQGSLIIDYQNKSFELEENNENTFSSYGIIYDFICKIDIL